MKCQGKRRGGGGKRICEDMRGDKGRGEEKTG